MCDSLWQQCCEGTWDLLVGADDAVNSNLQWKWSQQRKGAHQQAEQEEACNMEPVGPRLAQQSAVQGPVGGILGSHHTSPFFRRSRTLKTATATFAHSI